MNATHQKKINDSIHTHIGEYGVFHIVGHRRLDLGGWMQDNVYVANDDTLHRESYHATGPDDLSAYHMINGGGYDPDCNWCYLNVPHTEDAHKKSLPAQEDK